VNLFVSEENRPNASADLGWGSRVASLTMQTIQGDHHSMLLEPYRTALTDHVKHYLAEAFKQHDTPLSG
jgi:thioesterase domain-containing protein